MKKSKWIAMLEQIEGDPDILLWNDHANDYQDVEPTLEKQQLARISFDAYVGFIEEERKATHSGNKYKLSSDDLKYLKKQFTEHHEWKINPWVTDEDINKDIFKVKNVYMVKGKPRAVDVDITERYTKQKYQ